MTDNSDEVKELLTALAHKIVQMDDQLTSKTRELMNPNKIMRWCEHVGLDTAMALYGLKSMDHTSPQVRVILGALIYKIRNSENMQFQLKELSWAIIGLEELAVD